MQILKGKIKRPQKVILYGPEGIGKSTLGASFPNALLIDVEKGSGHLDIDRATVDSFKDVCDVLDELFATSADLPYQTIVIDTADWLEQMIITSVCKTAGVKSIEEFGYGKGYVYMAEDMMLVLNKLDQLVNVGLNVVIIAHSHVKPRAEPGIEVAYDRYELKCSKRITALMMEWADAVLFINYQVSIETNKDGKTRATGGTDRLLLTEHTAAYDAKNRWGLPAEVMVGPMDNPMPEEILAHLQTAPVAEKPASKKKEEKEEPDQLESLMAQNNITKAELNKLLKKKGVKKLTDEVKEKLITNWDKVVEQIEGMK